MGVGLIGCTKRKLSYRAPAEKFYSPSAMFRGRRACVQQSCDRLVHPLSAEHDVVSPSLELDPYDVSLGGAGAMSFSASISSSLLATMRLRRVFSVLTFFNCVALLTLRPPYWLRHL
jgi:hypothetical protein